MSSPSSIASSSAGRMPPPRSPTPTPPRTHAQTQLPSSSEPPRFQNKARHSRVTRAQAKGLGRQNPGDYQEPARSPGDAKPPAATNTVATQEDDDGDHRMNVEGDASSSVAAARSPISGRFAPYPPSSIADTPTNSNTTSPTTSTAPHTPLSRNNNFKHRGNNTRRQPGGRHNHTNAHNNYPGNHAQNRSARYKAGGIKKNYGANNNALPQHPRFVRSGGSGGLHSTWDVPPPPIKLSADFHANRSYQVQRPTWDHYTNLSLDDLDRAKNLVLDLLGWGVETEYLLHCGVSAQLIHRVFTDLNLRLPHDFVAPSYPS